MANTLYEAFKSELLGDAGGPGHGTVDWEADTLRTGLIDTADYTINATTDADFTDLVGVPTAFIGNSGNNGLTDGESLTSKTVALSGGSASAAGTATMDAADATLTSVTGDQAEAVVIYKDSGTAGTSLLIVYFDTFASGMPVTPNGGDITISWNASGIWTM